LAINPDSTTPQARRYVTGVDTPFGVTIAAGTADPTGNGKRIRRHQRIIQMGGSQSLIAWVGSRIYRTTDGGATWGTPSADFAALVPAMDTTQDFRLGPLVVFNTGVPRVFVAFATTTSANHLRIAYSDDLGATWAVSGEINVGAGTPGLFTPHNIVLWRQQAIVSTGTNPGLSTIIIDPIGLTGSRVANLNLTGADASNVAFCVWNDRFFGSWMDSTNQLRLYEFSGGGWGLVNSIDATNGYSATQVGSNGWAMFVNPATDTLFILAFTTSPAQTWTMWEITSLSPFSVTNRTSLLPSAMQAVVGGDTRAGIITDGQESPGSQPSIYLYYAANQAAGGFAVYQWAGIGGGGFNNPSIGSGGNVLHAIPWGYQNGGEIFWTSGANHIEVVSKTAVIGGIRYTFRLYSLTGTDIVNVRAWQTNAAGEYLTTAATLANPSHGSMSGNSNIGLTANNGATSYQVTWNVTADGMVSGQRGKIVFEVYV
jgi:hypothetical protein